MMMYNNSKKRFLSGCIRIAGFVFLLFSAKYSYAQNHGLDSKIKLERLEGSISYFIKEIEKQSEVRFLYDNSRIKIDNELKFTDKQEYTIQQILDGISAKMNISFVTKGNHIVIKNRAISPTKLKKPKSATIKGYIKDKETGESLIGAHVINQQQKSGVTTNYYGFYSLTVPTGKTNLHVSYVGYDSKIFEFNLQSDTTINVGLTTRYMDEVVVSGQKPHPIQETTEMGTVRMTSNQIKSRPVLGGEVDVIKALQLLPGVQSGHEGSSGLYVRGGGPDQNLILLDGVPVYNVSHLFGFMSVFNADAINNVKLVKGAYPARYGGRLSSIVDISMREGNMHEFHGEGSAGLIATKLMLEGPLKKSESSFMISGRRTYIDILARPFIRPTEEKTSFSTRKTDPDGGYYFYDLNAKLNYRLSDKDRIYFSTYSGKDVGFYEQTTTETTSFNKSESNTRSNLNWGSTIALLRWNHIVSKKLFGNMGLSYSKYQFLADNRFSEVAEEAGETITDFQRFSTSSGIRDWSAKIDFDYFPHPNHNLKFGSSFTWHRFSPNVVGLRSNVETDTTFNANDIFSKEMSMYIEDDFKVNHKLMVNIGMHLSAFYVNRQWYSSIQPRLSGRYLLRPDLAIKASYTRMTQYLNLLTNPGIGLPTDFWVPSTDRVQPQQARQYSLGIAYTHPVHDFEVSVEGYHKEMDNLIEYKEGAGFLKLNENWQDKIESGSGRSYGVEIFVRKKFSKTDGWIGYTLSTSNRRFENLNFGREFPFKFDRRHDISAVLDHKFSKKISVSTNWVYGTGTALTLPQAEYLGLIDHSLVNDQSVRFLQSYNGRNSFRMRSYHRLDLSISFHKTTSWGQRDWVISIYNLYSRRNPFYIERRAIEDFDDIQRNDKFREVTLFPIIPSVSYRVKF